MLPATVVNKEFQIIKGIRSVKRNQGIRSLMEEIMHIIITGKAAEKVANNRGQERPIRRLVLGSMIKI